MWYLSSLMHEIYTVDNLHNIMKFKTILYNTIYLDKHHKCERKCWATSATVHVPEHKKNTALTIPKYAKSLRPRVVGDVAHSTSRGL